MKDKFNTEYLTPIDQLLEKSHQRHMDALWEGKTERAERAFREYQRLLKEYQEGVLYVPEF